MALLHFLDYRFKCRLPYLLLRRFRSRLFLRGEYFLRVRYEHFTLRPLGLHARETLFYLLTQIRPKLLWMFREPHPKLF